MHCSVLAHTLWRRVYPETSPKLTDGKQNVLKVSQDDNMCQSITINQHRSIDICYVLFVQHE